MSFMVTQQAQNIYLVGIKGVGMTAIAVYLKEQGHKVWGSDVEAVFPTDDMLREKGIEVLVGFKAENITTGIDLVVTTGAHEGLNNQEVVTAKQKGIKVQTLSEFVGEEGKKFKNLIAVCGSHGKTTTSAMVAHVFHKLGLSASHLVGTDRFAGLLAGHFGGYDYLVVEADEYMASPGIDDTPRFMYLSPNVIICTSVDYDHPDVYPKPSDLEQAYMAFFNKLDSSKGGLIYCLDDEKLSKLVMKLKMKQTFPYHEPEITLMVPGRHNKLNAGAVIAMASFLNLNKENVVRALQSFSGASRRLQIIFKAANIILYDDYAHHPVEISASIEAIHSIHPNKRLIVVFQSHTYSRTARFLNEFIESLANADSVFITEIFSSAREKEATITAEEFVKQARDKGHLQFQAVKKPEIASELSKTLQQNTVIVLMGAGNLYEHYDEIIRVIEKK